MRFLFSRQLSKKIFLILAIAVGLYAIADFSGYTPSSIFRNNKAVQEPTVICALELSGKTDHGSELSVRHPEIVIRNQGTATALSVQWNSKVFRYDIEKGEITGLATHGGPDRDNTGKGKQLIPSGELRYPTIGLFGENIVTIYLIRLDYLADTGTTPLTLERYFFVENDVAHPNSRFKDDPRYGQIMRKLNGFVQAQAPTEGSTAASHANAEPGQKTTVASSPADNGFQKSDRPGSSAQDPIFTQVFYVYRAGGKGPLKSIKRGEELKSGDHYKVYFRTSKDCYAYVYQLDAEGSVFRLFPMDRFGGVLLHNDNPVKAGSDYVLPSKDRFFYLDDVVGKEQIMMAVYSQQNSALETIDAALDQAMRLNDATQTGNAGKELVEYLTAGDLNETVQTMISPVAWQANDSASPVSGYFIESSEGGSIHTLEFFHR